MKTTMIVSLMILGLAALSGCDSDNGKKESEPQDTRAPRQEDVASVPETTADAPLPVCPDEVILTGLLPCDCYGMIATDPDAQVPGCKTQVVCCPKIGGLRCEDHELLEKDPEVVGQDVVPEQDLVVPPEVAEDVPETPEEVVDVPTCPFEVDLSDYTPCMCKDTLVEHVHTAMPDCDKKVVCCPISGVKCE